MAIDKARLLRRAHARIDSPETRNPTEAKLTFWLLVGGASIIFSCGIMAVFDVPSVLAAIPCGLTVGLVAYELLSGSTRRTCTASSYATDPQSRPVPDEHAAPVLLQAVVQFAPRLHRLTRLAHGRFSQADAGCWQSDVMLTAYVMGLVDGRAELERLSEAPRNLLAHFIGVSRAEAAIARLCSGAAPWTNGLFEVIEAIGHMDRVRLRAEQLSVCIPDLERDRRYG